MGVICRSFDLIWHKLEKARVAGSDGGAESPIRTRKTDIPHFG